MTRLDDQEFARRALELEWLLCDVDGVLTDGGLYYDRRGHQLLRFNAKDGLGLQLAQQAGLKVGLFSGRGAATASAGANARPERPSTTRSGRSSPTNATRVASV